ncbi:endocuticle structural glycoprotein SgAbd-2-like [Ischnura elegans]|uniref:endocuticle structural glycoprotein SgAbd-2-like n=1 Tax=Ischnura elegans TaxID=197161 RepID=UPI001ED89224|nr:endocuticle structural glycoprotein SgAbd-2-like [Ischnura elegans]
MKAVLLLLFVATVANAQFFKGRGGAASPAQRFRPAVPPPLPVAAAAARGPAPNIIPIVRQAQDVGFDGTFQYSYETANGITVQEKGYLKNAGVKDQEAQAVEGSFSYPGPDGKLLTVRYYADETGFHAEGDHLPVPVKA